MPHTSPSHDASDHGSPPKAKARDTSKSTLPQERWLDPDTPGLTTSFSKVEIAYKLGGEAKHLVEAHALDRLDYWLARATECWSGKWYVWKKFEDWGDEIGVNRSVARTAFYSLRDRGLVESIRNPGKSWDQTLRWTINYDELERLLSEIRRTQSDDASYTERHMHRTQSDDERRCSDDERTQSDAQYHESTTESTQGEYPQQNTHERDRAHAREDPIYSSEEGQPRTAPGSEGTSSGDDDTSANPSANLASEAARPRSIPERLEALRARKSA